MSCVAAYSVCCSETECLALQLAVCVCVLQCSETVNVLCCSL